MMVDRLVSPIKRCPCKCKCKAWVTGRALCQGCHLKGARMVNMDWPSGVTVIPVDGSGTYQLASPYHADIVDWAKRQPIHQWNKEARVWQFRTVDGSLSELHTLCWALWPDGNATPQQGTFPRRPIKAGYRGTAEYRKQSTVAGGPRCNVTGCQNPGDVTLASTRAPYLCTACLESLGRAILQHYGVIAPKAAPSAPDFVQERWAQQNTPVESPTPAAKVVVAAQNPQEAISMPSDSDDALAALFS